MQKNKVFIINLKRSVERREFMQRQIEPLAQAFEFIFFDAVDAAQGEHLRFEKHFSHVFGRMFKGRILKDAEKAVFASHYTLWKKCVELDEPVFILEDDVLLKEEFESGVLDISQSGYGLVRLFILFGRDKHPLGGHYSIFFEKVGGAQGYYITPEVAAKLIKKAKTWFCPVDDLMDMSFYTKVANVVYEPYLLEHTDAETTISAARGGKSGGFWKISREFIRIFRFAWKRSYIALNKKRLLKELGRVSK